LGWNFPFNACASSWDMLESFSYKNTAMYKKDGREKISISLMKKKETNSAIFIEKLTSCHALPWNWQEAILLLGICCFTFPVKIKLLRATYQPLKNCGPCALLQHGIRRNCPMVWMDSHAIVTNVQMHRSESSTESWQVLL